MTLKVSRIEPHIEGTLNDLEDHAEGFYRHKDGMEEAFQQGDQKGRWIPAADADGSIFFDNRETLYRFVGMSVPMQRVLLIAVRKAMETYKVRQLYLNVPWSRTGTKTLRILQNGPASNLSILTN